MLHFCYFWRSIDSPNTISNSLHITSYTTRKHLELQNKLWFVVPDFTSSSPKITQKRQDKKRRDLSYQTAPLWGGANSASFSVPCLGLALGRLNPFFALSILHFAPSFKIFKMGQISERIFWDLQSPKRSLRSAPVWIWKCIKKGMSLIEFQNSLAPSFYLNFAP